MKVRAKGFDFLVRERDDVGVCDGADGPDDAGAEGLVHLRNWHVQPAGQFADGEDSAVLAGFWDSDAHVCTPARVNCNASAHGYERIS